MGSLWGMGLGSENNSALLIQYDITQLHGSMPTDEINGSVGVRM
jgi:hypothetical protein